MLNLNLVASTLGARDSLTMDSSEAQPVESPASSATTDLKLSRGLIVIASVAVVWYLVLLSLALFTANPVQLNVQQILDSGWIVLATVDENGVVHERKTVQGLLPEGPLKLSDKCRYTDREIILPLVREFGDYHITPTHLPNGDRLVYPATPAALRQLDEILSPPPQPAAKK